MKNQKKETIIRAAVRVDGEVFSIPPPARHHDCLRRAAEYLETGQDETWEHGGNPREVSCWGPGVW